MPASLRPTLSHHARQVCQSSSTGTLRPGPTLQRSAMNALIGEASSSRSSMASRALAGCTEVAALPQPPVAVQRPVEDAGQLGGQPRGERGVFAAVERLREHEHDQASDQCARRVGRCAAARW